MALLYSSTHPDIPIINFVAFTEGNACVQRAIAQQLYHACETVGFVYLQDDSISPGFIKELFQKTQLFFNLPTSVKQQSVEASPTFGGYMGIEEECLNSQRPADLKEALDLRKQTIQSLEDPVFAAVLSQFYHHCTTLLVPQIFRAFELALRLPEHFFIKRHQQLYSLRLLHYPPFAQSFKPEQVWAGEHTDVSTLTLLLSEQIGGLEICTKQGDWLAVPQVPNAIGLFIGEVMQRWTNNRLKAVRHRVVSSESHTQGSRYSLVLFCDPDPDVQIACLDTCVEPGQMPLYAPVRAGDYLEEHLQMIYRKSTVL